jgi:hypothetical protein
VGVVTTIDDARANAEGSIKLDCVAPKPTPTDVATVNLQLAGVSCAAGVPPTALLPCSNDQFYSATVAPTPLSGPVVCSGSIVIGHPSGGSCTDTFAPGTTVTISFSAKEAYNYTASVTWSPASLGCVTVSGPIGPSTALTASCTVTLPPGTSTTNIQINLGS